MLNMNTNLIIGKTNTGKTKGILFKEVVKVIDNNENLFILDNRGEYYNKFAAKVKEKGYNTFVINLNNPKLSNGFNPLMLAYEFYKNNDKDKAVNCIESISSELFKEDNINSTVDPFWGITASNYVIGLILTLFKNANKEEINFGSIITLLTQGAGLYNDKKLFKEYLNTLNPNDTIYLATSPTEFAPRETKGSILSVVRQKLNVICMREELLNMLSTNDLSLNNISNKTAIFVIGNSIISNILLNQLLQVIIDKKMSFNLILDNFDSYTRFININDLLDNASYNNLKISIAIKDLEEIKFRYGQFLTTKFDNVIYSENENLTLMDEGNYNEFPKLEISKQEYFDFEKFMKDNFEI